MSYSRPLGTVLCVLASVSMPALAGSHSGGAPHHHGGSHHHGGGFPFGVGGGWAGYPFPYYQSFGVGGFPIVFMPPIFAYSPNWYPPYAPPVQAPGWNGNALAGPMPPLAMGRPVADVPKRKKSEPEKSKQLVTVGDRLFRAGNNRRAAERYEQAAKADPHAAAPRVRLAQCALVKGQYIEAANHFREAQTAEPGWLANATDIQTIYAEPADFAKQIAALESHLQVHPRDRDAWLVLGAQWYLSGRTQKASDVFLRLSDRAPDATLAAFLDASTPAAEAR